MRISLLGAAFETGNMGVRALAVGAIRCILAQYPDAEISLVDYSRKSALYSIQFQDRMVSVPLVNLRFSIRFYLSNNIAFLVAVVMLLRLIPSRRLRERLMAKNARLRHLLQADLVLSIAGGDSFSDIYGLTRLFYVALPQILALLMQKKLILLPQTYGPFRTNLARLIARYIVRQAAMAYSRDYRSLGTVRNLLGRAKAGQKPRFSYDVAFAVEPIEPRRLDVAGIAWQGAAGKVVGLNVSGLLSMGGYSRSNMFGLGVDYKGLMLRLIDCLITREGASVLLVPHVFGSSSNPESDVSSCQQLYEVLGSRYPARLGVLCGTYDQSEIKYLIGQCDFFIGSRMHACIAAVSQNIPAVCISYSDKFIGVMETIGIEALVADARRMSEDEIVELVEQAYHERHAIKEQLAAPMMLANTAVLQLLADSANPIKGIETKDCQKSAPGSDHEVRCRCMS